MFTIKSCLNFVEYSRTPWSSFLVDRFYESINPQNKQTNHRYSALLSDNYALLDCQTLWLLVDDEGALLSPFLHLL